MFIVEHTSALLQHFVHNLAQSAGILQTVVYELTNSQQTQNIQLTLAYGSQNPSANVKKRFSPRILLGEL